MNICVLKRILHKKRQFSSNYKNPQFHYMVPADDHLQEAGPQFDKGYEKCIIVRKVIVMLIVMTLLDKLIMTFIIITLF